MPSIFKTIGCKCDESHVRIKIAFVSVEINDWTANDKFLYYIMIYYSYLFPKKNYWSYEENDEAIDESNDAVKCPVSSVLTIIISYVFFFITECLLLRGCWCLVYSLPDMIGYTVTHKPLIYKNITFYQTPTYYISLMQILIWPGQAHFLIISPHLFFGQTCANDCKVDSSTSNRTVGGTPYPTPPPFSFLNNAE